MPSLALYYYTKLFLKTIWLEVEMALVQFFNSLNYELGLLIAEHKRLKPLNMNGNKYNFLYKMGSMYIEKVEQTAKHVFLVA